MRVKNSMCCPNCCAKLNIQPYSRRVVCKYCDSVLTIEPERSSTQNFSAGGAQDAEKIQQLRMDLGNLNLLKTRIEECNKKLKKLRTEKYIPRPTEIPPYQNTAGVGCVAIFFFVLVGLRILRSDLATGLFLLGICAFGIFLLVKHTKKEKAAYQVERARLDAEAQAAQAEWENNHQRELLDTESALENAKSEISELKNQADFGLVPEKYHNEAALKYMYDVLNTNQAFNIGQAISLYEMHQEHEKREA